jgi:hypothetical protein
VETTTARGAASGAVGVVAMDVVTWLLHRRERRLDLLRAKRLRATLGSVEGDVTSW